MKRLTLLIVLLLSACAPVAVATDPPAPTATRIRPTQTPRPTATERPAATATAAPDLDEIRQGIIDAFIADLEAFPEVTDVILVRFNDGRMEVEVNTIWSAQDAQPDAHWNIVREFSAAFEGVNERNMEIIAGGNPFVFAVTTNSIVGDYTYQSLTDWDTLQKLANKSLSFDEWVEAAEAGFE